MGKFSHKVFKSVVKEISQDLLSLKSSGSEVFHVISEKRNFAEVTKLSRPPFPLYELCGTRVTEYDSIPFPHEHRS